MKRNLFLAAEAYTRQEELAYLVSLDKEKPAKVALGYPALELGFLETLKILFLPSKAKTKSEARQWQDAFNSRAEVLAKRLKETLADPEWVKAHYKEGPVTMERRYIAYLLVGGKVGKPLQAYELAKPDFESVAHAAGASIVAYAKALIEGENEIEAFFKKNPKDDKAVEKFAKGVMKSIKLPVIKPYDEQVARARHELAEKLKDKPLPPLSLNDAIALGKRLHDEMKTLENYEKLPAIDTSCGGGLDADFWDDYPGYDGERLRTGAMGDFFYFQSKPDRAVSGVMDRYFDVTQAYTSSVAWLLTLCGVTAGRKLGKDE